jgi:hypothetical protein
MKMIASVNQCKTNDKINKFDIIAIMGDFNARGGNIKIH